MHIQPDEAVDDNRRHHAIGRHAKDDAHADTVPNDFSDPLSDAYPDAHADTKPNTYANAEPRRVFPEGCAVQWR